MWLLGTMWVLRADLGSSRRAMCAFHCQPEFILEVNIKQSDRRPHRKPSLATLSVLMVFSDSTDHLQTLSPLSAILVALATGKQLAGVGRGTWPFLDIGFIICEVVSGVLALAEAM